jgi:hypothetical protein
MKSEDRVASPSATALGDRDERLAKICETLREVLLEVDDLGLKLVGAQLDGVIVEVEGERDRTSR